MTNKEQFLKMNVGFHYEDLPLEKQLELEAIKNSMNLSTEWVYLALSKCPMEEWCKWGFGLFRKPDFKNEIDALLTAFNKADDSRFAKEIKRKKEKDRGLYVSEATFKKVYDGVMAQGALYDTSNLPYYWSYGYSLTDEGRRWIDNLIESKQKAETFSDEDKTRFCLACQKIINQFQF